MTDTLPSLERRRVLRALAALPLAGPASELLAAPPQAAPTLTATPALGGTPFPEGATILIAGPEAGAMAHWSQAMHSALAEALAPGIALHQTTAGGADGVTGANQFDTRVAPDGRTVLLTPGEAVLAWLVGDPRAKFDVNNWVPVAACVTPGVVMGHRAALTSAGPVHIAAAHPAGHDLPATLAVELLGGRAELVGGLTDDTTLATALAHHAVDAVLLHGHNVQDRAATLAGSSAQPLFSLGMLDDEGHATRCAVFPEIPTFAELYAQLRHTQPSGPAYAAWQAAAAAVQLEFALVLPQLTPAAMVALWRRAGVEAAGALDVQSLAQALGVRPVSGPIATATTAAAAADTPALLALRKWLAARFNWKPA